MATFSIAGNFKLGSQWRDFKKNIEAETEEHARELLFKTFGSKHSLPRRFINIVEIAETTEHSVVLTNESRETPSATDD